MRADSPGRARSRGGSTRCAFEIVRRALVPEVSGLEERFLRLVLGLEGRTGGVEFVLHVDWDSPLHVQVTITVFEPIEHFQVAG